LSFILDGGNKKKCETKYNRGKNIFWTTIFIGNDEGASKVKEKQRRTTSMAVKGNQHLYEKNKEKKIT